jgi:hypothetical protein
MFFAPAICFHDVRTRLLLGLFCAWLCASATAGQPRLVVDTEAQTLIVILTDRPLLTLHDLSIGRYGTTLEKRRGDGRTPLGQFRVTDVKRDSAFHRFIALSYPDAERAARGRQQGDIGASELRAILAAHRKGESPPQDTFLGGGIGIHGLGKADPALHRAMNWTRGCVAVTDRQLDSLLPWVEIGMQVDIR